MSILNIFKKSSRNSVKNSLIEEYEIPKNIDLLNKWSIPKIQPKVLYELGTFEELGLIQLVKTTEETITLENNEMKIKLLNQRDIDKYIPNYNYLHIGLVQIAFKPLTLQGLPESFIAVLRDGRNMNWKQSLIGIIQSSLSHGPVYVNVYPNLQLSLSDVNILDALTLNVKTHGYNYIPGSELICICYRIYYKPLTTMNPKCKRMNKPNNETILIESNFNKSKISTRRLIKWDEIEFPQNWIIEEAVTPQPKINSNLSRVIQTSNGTIQIEFEEEPENTNDSLIRRTRSHRSSTSHSHFSPLDYKVEIPSRSSASQIREEDDINSKIENLKIRNNIVTGVFRDNEEPTPSVLDFDL